MNVPDFTIPALLAKISEKLPSWPADQMVVLAMNMGIRFNVFSKSSLETLEGRVVGFEVLDLSYKTAITHLNGKFWRADVSTAELMIRANAAPFLQLLSRQEDPDALFFNRTLVLEGDTELGLIVKNMLDNVDWTAFSESPIGQLLQSKLKAWLRSISK